MGHFRNIRALAIAALFLPLAMSCASLREGDEDEGDPSGPSKLSDRIANFDRNKEFDKQALNIRKSYADTPEKSRERSSFNNKSFRETKAVEASRYNTERYNGGGTQEPRKKKWYQFTGGRDKKQKASSFTTERARADTEAYSTSQYTGRSNVESIYGSRSERDVSARYLSTEIPGTGEPSPTIIRQPTVSEGDIRALLNGP